MSKNKRKLSLAQRADKYELYQKSVQQPEADIRLLRRVYRNHFGRRPRTLREDFCGTAALACQWIAAHPKNRAFGVDLDPEPLAWGREHNVSELSRKEARRLTLIQGDVRAVTHEPVDVTVAFNFSYFLFKDRPQLLEYFSKARTTLNGEGIFAIDVFGGADAHKTLEEVTDHDDFDYRWEQEVFDPIHQEVVSHIHFSFPDGSSLDQAFTYEWRLWSIPEIRELMEEAGFSKTEVYWEGTDKKTWEGNGVFRVRESASDDPAWIAYVVAIP